MLLPTVKGAYSPPSGQPGLFRRLGKGSNLKKEIDMETLQKVGYWPRASAQTVDVMHAHQRRR